MRLEDIESGQPFHICPDCHERDGAHGVGCPSDESDRAVAWAEVQRGDVRAIQRRVLASLGHDAVTIPSGTTRLHSREEDR